MENRVEKQKDALHAHFDNAEAVLEGYGEGTEAGLSPFTMSEAILRQWERTSNKVEGPVCVVVMPPEIIQWLDPEDRAEIEDQRHFIQKGVRRMQNQVQLRLKPTTTY